MLITTSKKKPNITITACSITKKSQIKYLDVFIDEHLTWDAQLKHISNKLMKNIGILYKLRYFLSIDALKQLYYSFIYPYLNYGLMSWGTAYQSRLKKIKIKQNDCLRCIFFAKNKRVLLLIIQSQKFLKLKTSSNLKYLCSYIRLKMEKELFLL